MVKIAGIDPGVYGAMVVIDEKGKVQGYCDFPIRDVDNHLDPALRFDVGTLREMLKQPGLRHDHAFLELPTLYGKIGKYNLATLVFSFASIYVLLPKEPNCITAQTWRKEMVAPLYLHSEIIKLSGRCEGKTMRDLPWLSGHSKQKLQALQAFKLHCQDLLFYDHVQTTPEYHRQSGRAEAYLIALYGLRLCRQGFKIPEGESC